jgi:hypothetical protein
MTLLTYQRSQKWFYLPLVLSIGFLSSYMGVHTCYGKIKKLESSLSPSEKELYKEVQFERRDIYFKAMIQSLILVLAYVIFHKLVMCSESMYYLGSNILLLFLGGTYLFYTLLPKQKSMILDANLSNEETKRWYQVYLCMQDSFWRMFVAGLIVSSFVLLLLDSFSPKATMMVIPVKKISPKKKNKRKNK